MLSRPDDDSGQQAQLCHTFRQIAVDSVVPIPDVKDATIALSAAELPVGTVVVFFNLDHHPSFASNHFVNPKYLVGQIKGDIVTPHQVRISILSIFCDVLVSKHHSMVWM